MNFGATSRTVAIVFAITLLSFSDARSQSSDPVQLKLESDKVTVQIDGQDFTALHFQRDQKPILYPVLGPGQVAMTRHWPVKDGVKGEAHDHPHHQSVWFGHEINGIDFWAHRSGVVKVKSVTLVGEKKNQIKTTSDWIRKEDQQVILTDETMYRFGGDESGRWVDFTITLRASEQDLVLEDTKEGCFAVRTHPDLRLTASPKDGVENVFGKAVNSNGESGKGIWGKAAKWVLYYGTINGQEMAIAMFDHPDNMRFPTTWHARDYGLVAANRFGLHYFAGKENGAGEYKLPKGESLTLRYRIDFLKGNPSADEIEDRFKRFAEAD